MMQNDTLPKEVPAPDPRPALRLVSTDPPVAWTPGRPVLVPATPPDCAVGPECPVCTDTLDTTPDLLCEDTP